jgi:aconitate hydratase
MLGLTFADKNDYNKVQEDDNIDILGLTSFAPGVPLTIVLNHADGTKDEIKANHTYNEQQIEWFKAGGALNIIQGKCCCFKSIKSKSHYYQKALQR